MREHGCLILLTHTAGKGPTGMEWFRHGWNIADWPPLSPITLNVLFPNFMGSCLHQDKMWGNKPKRRKTENARVLFSRRIQTARIATPNSHTTLYKNKKTNSLMTVHVLQANLVWTPIPDWRYCQTKRNSSPGKTAVVSRSEKMHGVVRW